MAAHHIDRLDRKILQTLSEEGYLKNVELAKKVGLSPSACFQHVARLKKDKIIRGFHADIDATKITPFISVMTMLMLEKQNQAEYQKMNNIIQDIPQIVRAHRTTGEFDYILETHAQDFNSFRNIIEDLVNRDVVVKQYHSRIMQEQVKFRGNIDFPEDR